MGNCAVSLPSMLQLFRHWSVASVLGCRNLVEDDYAKLGTCFDTATVLPLDDEVIWEAVRLRQLRRMPFWHALVAATALAAERTLVTRNDPR